MKRYHYLFLIVLLATLLLLTLRGSSIFAQKPRENRAVLRQAVLRRSDFPEKTSKYTFHSAVVDTGEFGGQVSFVTVPFRVEGFMEAYRVNGWYPVAFNDNRYAGFTPGAFVENIAYLFANQKQAAHAFSQQITQLNADAKNLAMKAESVQYGDLKGELARMNYRQVGVDYTLYTFIGLARNNVILLMVDGVPDKAVQKTFEHLVARLVGYQQ